MLPVVCVVISGVVITGVPVIVVVVSNSTKVVVVVLIAVVVVNGVVDGVIIPLVELVLDCWHW